MRKPHVERLESRRVLAHWISTSLDGLWSQVSPDSIPVEIAPTTRVTHYGLFQLNPSSLALAVDQAPLEFSGLASTETISIPTPSGSYERFQVFVSPIMSPELAARFPEIQTYAGQGIDDPTSSLRFDVTPLGFHAQVLSSSGAYYVDPYASGSDGLYVSYNKKDNPVRLDVVELPYHEDASLDRTGSSGNSGSDSEPPPGTDPGLMGSRVEGRSGGELRTYRLAVAATGEYTQFHGGTVAAGQAAIVTAINRVTGIYRSELSVNFSLVGNNDRLVYTNGATDPYTNNDGFRMLSENQANVDLVIGNANYDIGHVFSTGGGGVASLGSVGINARKAQGVTGLPSPINDVFYVDFVAHEMGHQFGGNHSFNGRAGNCGARNAATAYEPGSGTTIQAYAGICGSDDLQPNSDPYFHSISFDEIIAHVDLRIPGVGVRTPTGNTIPVVNAGGDHVIPARTPFVLTASGSDGDLGDALTYSWEQRDLGPAQFLSDPDNGSSPLFRFWTPTQDPTRTFPRLVDLIANTTSRGEKLPTTNRLLNFRAVVRDNRFSGGGVNTDDMVIRVVDTGSAFAVTAPNTNVTWEGNSTQTVSWNVAGTDGNGINASLVDIRMSSDGGMTYPYLLAEGVANDGVQEVRVPNAPGVRNRIRVQAAAGIFFDISDANFEITPSPRSIDIRLGGPQVYVENAPPVFVTPTATVTSMNVPTLAGGVLSVAITAGRTPGDRLNVLPGGSGTASIAIVNGRVSNNGVEFGTLTVSGTNLTLQLLATATNQAVESFLRRVVFDSTSDEPTSTPRILGATLDAFDNGISNNATMILQVQPVNDAPTSDDAFLADVKEDTLEPVGATLAVLLADGFQDPDAGATLSGIIVVQNATPANQGAWQYAAEGSTEWQDVGSVSASAGLALNAASRLRFRPGLNYFGDEPSLMFRVLDNTYTDEFTTSATRVFRSIADASATGPIALASNWIRTRVTPVNDPPTPVGSLPSIAIDQGQFLQYEIGEDLFIDVDDAAFTMSVQPAGGGRLPGWLRFNTITRILSGTPANADVGVYHLQVVATDPSNASGSIPWMLTVNNVNDPPFGLRLEGNSVMENASGVRVGALIASDPDPMDSLTFSVADPRFEIRDASLFLRAGVSFDYEQVRSIVLPITVTDSGTPSLSLTVPVQIDIINVNEFAPEMSYTDFEISEDAAAGSWVGRMQATDRDADTLIRYRLVEPSDLFSVNSETGDIALRSGVVLDHETRDAHQIFVEAFDNGVPQRSVAVSVAIRVTDVNEFTPAILTSILTVPENATPAKPFGRILATDGDIRQSVRFEILQTDLPPYTWNANTGEFTLAVGSQFDFETKDQYFAVVQAIDSGTPSRSSVTTVAIQITDSNDPPSGIWLQPNTVLSEISGAVIGRMQVLDQDVGQLYQVISLDSRFIVVGDQLQLAPSRAISNQDPDTLVVFMIATELQAEGRSYPLQVQVTRIANPRPWQNSANPMDVNRDGGVNALDVLAVVNATNQGIVDLPKPRPASTLSLPDVDVDGDSQLSPLDVLALVNYINGNVSSSASVAGEGEANDSQAQQTDLAFSELGNLAETWNLAHVPLEDELLMRRRRR